MGKKSTLANIFYNSFGTIFYYGCQWLTTIFVVRLSGFTDAGTYNLAMTFTAAFSILALFNTRQYQVSDVTGEYSDRAYIDSRLAAMAIAFSICVAGLCFNHYTPYQWGVIVLYMLHKCGEAWIDVYHGIDQKHGRMDYVCYSYLVRGCLMLFTFCGALYLTKDLVCAVGAITSCTFLMAFAYDKRIAEHFLEKKEKADSAAVRKLLSAMAPLVIVAVANNLSISLPKYFLQMYYGDEMLGFYSSVATPSMVVQVAAQTVFVPLITPLAGRLQENDRHSFTGILKKVSAAFVILSIPTLLLSFLLGEWFLVLVFHEEIRPYAYLFMPVIASTLFIAINGCLFPVCTVLREIKGQLFVGIAGAASSLAASIFFVKRHKMDGVVIALLITLGIQIIIEVFLVYHKMRKWKEADHG